MRKSKSKVPIATASTSSNVYSSSNIVSPSADLFGDKENEMNELEALSVSRRSSSAKKRLKEKLVLSTGTKKQKRTMLSIRNRDSSETCTIVPHEIESKVAEEEEEQLDELPDIPSQEARGMNEAENVLSNSVIPVQQEGEESQIEESDDDLFVVGTPQPAKTTTATFREKVKRNQKQSLSGKKRTILNVNDAKNKETTTSEPPTEILDEENDEEEAEDGPPSQVVPPLNESANKVIEQHRQFVLMSSGLDSKQKSSVALYATKVGCVTRATIDASVTHIVIGHNGNMRCERTLKYLQAVAAGKLIVGFKWIEDCLENKRHLDPKDYEVTDSTGVEGPKRARLRREQGKRLLFEKFEFCLLGGGFSGFITKDKLRMLLVACGGAVLRNVSLLSGNSKGSVCLAVVDKENAANDKKKLNEYHKMFHTTDVAVVDKSWVLESVATYTIQPVIEYLQHNSSIRDLVKAGYDERLLQETQSCLL